MHRIQISSLSGGDFSHTQIRIDGKDMEIVGYSVEQRVGEPALVTLELLAEIEVGIDAMVVENKKINRFELLDIDK